MSKRYLLLKIFFFSLLLVSSLLFFNHERIYAGCTPSCTCTGPCTQNWPFNPPNQCTHDSYMGCDGGGWNGCCTFSCSTVCNWHFIYRAAANGKVYVTGEGVGTATTLIDRSVSNSGTFSITALPNTGYKFVNWTCTNATYNNSNNPRVDTDVDIDCTANFALNSVTVNYSPGAGGTCTPSQYTNVVIGSSVAGSTCTRSGYTFANFSLNPASACAGFNTASGYCPSVSAAYTATAAWNLNPTVTYNFNGGTCDNASVTIPYNTTAAAPNCSRAGYTRTGYTRLSGSGGTLNTTTGAVTNVTGDQTIQPQYNIYPSAPSSLLAEGASNPIGVTDTTPEFSAIYNDGAGDTGRYYQIQVNTNNTFTGTSMWDSGKTSMSPLAVGSRTSDISYAGTALSLNGATYYWRIRFWDSVDAASNWSSVANFTMNTPPTAPTSLLTDNLTNPSQLTNLTPAFTAVFNDPNTSDTGNFYQIQVNTNDTFTGTSMWDSGIVGISPIANGSQSPNIIYNGTALSLNGVTYYWRIRFSDNYGTVGAWSSTATFRMLDVPAAATNLHGVPLSTTSIRWTFEDNSSSETGVRLYDSGGTLIKTCGGSDITYCDEDGLSENTQYTRYIIVYNTEAVSSPSNTASSYTLVSVPTLQFSGTKTDTSVTLVSSQPANGGELYFDCEGTCDTGINVWTTNQTATVTGLTQNTQYTFTVKSRNGDNVETANSTPVQVYTYASIPTLTPSVSSVSEISLTASNLENISSGQSGLFFECQSSNCSNGTNEWVKNQSTSVTDLLTNTQYTFRVKARNAEGDETAWSESVLRYTLASTPSISSVTPVDSSSMNIEIENADNPTNTEILIKESTTGKYLNPSTNDLETTPVWSTFSSLSQPSLVKNLSSGTVYSFTVQAKNGDGIETATSSSTSSSTLLTSIEAILPTVNSSTSITWNIGPYSDPITSITLHDEDGTLLQICPGTDIHSCTETGLLPSTTYSRKLKIHNNDISSESAFTNLVTTTTFANVPSLADIKESGYASRSSNLVVNKNMNSDETKYLIFESSTNKYLNPLTGLLVESMNWGTYSQLGGENGITVNGLIPNTNYIFSVKAKNIDDIETSYGAERSIQTLATVPSVASISQVDTTSLRVILDPSDNSPTTEMSLYDSFTQKYINPLTGELVVSPVWLSIKNWGGVNGFLVKNLLSNTQYSFCAKARNSENIETECSKESKMYTNAEGLSLSARTSGSTTGTLIVDLNGNPVGTEYEILDKRSGKYLNQSGILVGFPFLFKPIQESTRINIVYLLPNTRYDFVTRAKDGNGTYSNWSEVKSIVTYANPPSGVVSETINSSTIAVSFDTNNNSSGTTYAVQDVISKKYVDPQTGALVDNPVWATHEKWGGDGGFSVTGLVKGQEYVFAVKAKNSESIETSYTASNSVLAADWILMNVPPNVQVTLVSDPSVDVTGIENSQAGEKEIRVSEDGIIIADVPVLFDQNRNWGGELFQTDPENNKAVVFLDELSGLSGSYTLYAVVGDTNVFRVCPFATSLSSVYPNCLGSVLFKGPYPQTLKVGSLEVTVSQQEVKGVLYWVASGMTSGGGQGEKSNLIGELLNLFDIISGTIQGSFAWISDSGKLSIANLSEEELSVGSGLVTALTMTTSIATGSVAAGGFGQFTYWVLHMFSNFLSALGLKRKRKPYGYVYDSTTKNPLGQAIIRIFDKNHALVGTEVSDRDGIFWGTLDDGQYTLDVRRSLYTFPTKLIKGKDDYPMSGVYHGDSIYIKKDDMGIVIPMDPVEISGKDKGVSMLRRMLTVLIKVLSIIFFIVGLISAIYVYILTKTPVNLFILLFYIPVAFFLFWGVRNTERKYGKIVGKDGKPVEGVEIVLKDVEHADIVAKRITDKDGKYTFYVSDPGKYKLEILDRRVAIVGGRSEVEIKKKGSIAENITIEKL